MKLKENQWEYIKTDEVEDDIIENIAFGITISDARSAAFYGLGKANSTLSKIVLVCKTEEVANTLTAMTEAFYQNIPLVILSLGERLENKKMSQCFEPVTESIIFSNTIEKAFEQIKLKEHNGPIMAFCEYNKNNKNDSLNREREVIEIIRKEQDHSYRIFTTSVSQKNESSELSIYNHLEGGLYQFMGMCVASSEDQLQILLAPYKQIKDSLNAFNLRYLSENIVIICMDEKIKKHKEWFEINKVQYWEIEDEDKLREAVFSIKGKKVIYYK